MSPSAPVAGVGSRTRRKNAACTFRRTANLSFLNAINPLYAMSGFAVGFIVGLTGVGGGSLMTPLLVLLFGVHPATAVGTDLLYAGFTKAVGTAVHGHNGAVSWRIVSLLAS